MKNINLKRIKTMILRLLELLIKCRKNRDSVYFCYQERLSRCIQTLGMPRVVATGFPHHPT